MSTFISDIIAKAKTKNSTIVLPESDDPRILEAAIKIDCDGVAKLILIGNKANLSEKLPNEHSIEIVDPDTYDKLDELANLLYDLRKSKGLTLEGAYDLLKDPLYLGVMLVKTGIANGMVAGACHSTGDVLRPSLQILKTAPGVSYVSSCFIMDVPNCDYGDNGLFLFSDCGLEVQPDVDKLANIAVSSASTYKALTGNEARVALLSHSSMGSAKNDDAQKVVDAVACAKELAPELLLDGELQLDAAIVPEIGTMKAPNSDVAGKANVLIFPDLDSGNIGYKLVQRLAHAEAFGPITQGIARPVNDLSRGCSAEDVYGVIAITCVQA